jgi:hypothetical protein
LRCRIISSVAYFIHIHAGSEPDSLRWFAQAVAGILVPETLQKWGFMEEFSWYTAGEREYFADPVTLFVAQMVLMGWVEGRRWMDYLNPGSVDIEPRYPNRKNPTPDVGYPGGIWFDWGNWGRGSPEPVMTIPHQRDQERPTRHARTGGKRAYGPGLFGPLVSVAEPGSITRDQCRSRFQHEPGSIGLHVDALRREGAWVIGPSS